MLGDGELDPLLFGLGRRGPSGGRDLQREEAGDHEHASGDDERDARVEQPDGDRRGDPTDQAGDDAHQRQSRVGLDERVLVLHHRRAPAPTSRRCGPWRGPARRTPAGTGTASSGCRPSGSRPAPRPKHPTAMSVRRPARLRSSAGPMIGPTTANGAMVSNRYSSTWVRDWPTGWVKKIEPASETVRQASPTMLAGLGRHEASERVQRVRARIAGSHLEVEGTRPTRPMVSSPLFHLDVTSCLAARVSRRHRRCARVDEQSGRCTRCVPDSRPRHESSPHVRPAEPPSPGVGIDARSGLPGRLGDPRETPTRASPVRCACGDCRRTRRSRPAPAAQPGAVLARLQRPRARPGRGPRPAAARAGQVPRHLLVQPRRVRAGARLRPPGAGRGGDPGQDPGRHGPAPAAPGDRGPDRRARHPPGQPLHEGDRPGARGRRHRLLELGRARRRRPGVPRRGVRSPGLPGAHPARGRPGPPVPLHLEPVAQPRGRRARPRDPRAALRPGQGSSAAPALHRDARR